ncbi:unnamed protein product [Lampetra planeri]
MVQRTHKISSRLPTMVCGRRGINIPTVMVVLGALTFAWFIFTDNAPLSFSNTSSLKIKLKRLQQQPGDGTQPSSADGAAAEAAVPLESTPAEMAAEGQLLRARTHTLIMSTWRSGSSFVGQMFSQHPDIFYLFEPAWHVWSGLMAANARVLQPACRDMLAQLFRCDASVFDYYVPRAGNRDLSSLFMHATSRALCTPPACDAYTPAEISEEKACATACKHESFDRIGETCAQYKHVVIKEVRFFDLNVLKPLLVDPSLNLKIINLIRDPRAVALSRDNAPRGLKRDNGIVLERGGQLVLDANYTALKTICDSQADMGEAALVGKQPYWLRGRYRLVRFEDLVKEPRQTVLDLQAFAGVPRDDRIASWVHNLTHGSKSSGDVFYVVPKDAVKVAQKWRLELTFAKVLQVQKACERMMKIFGYRFIRTLGELKSMDVNLIDDLKFSVFGH